MCSTLHVLVHAVKSRGIPTRVNSFCFKGRESLKLYDVACVMGRMSPHMYLSDRLLLFSLPLSSSTVG